MRSRKMKYDFARILNDRADYNQPEADICPKDIEPQAEMTVEEILGKKTLQAKGKRLFSRAGSKRTHKTRKQRNLSPVLVLVVVFVTLLLLWVMIGNLMKNGVLPNRDLGYKWLNHFLSNILK